MVNNRKIYLDYAATTPVDSKVVEAMIPYFTEKFGNPSSLHEYGREANEALVESRKKIAKGMKALPEEIIFTSSATESNNLAVKGVAFANKAKGNHIVISSIEHDCVLNSAQWLETQGFVVSYLSVDKHGLIDSRDIKRFLRPETILVSVMHANNEIGTIQPVAKIGKICREAGIVFHVDASQTFGKIPVDVGEMNADLLTVSSHKMYGPKGVAALFIREGVRVQPILHGGGHEQGLRSSTVNVSLIVGFAKAVELCNRERTKEMKRLIFLRDKLIKGVLTKIPDSFLNGHQKKRLPNNANFRFSFVEGESVVLQLDNYGIAASSASACSSPKLEPSHVLLATGLRHEEAHGSLRVSLGRWTKEEDINYILKVLPEVIKNLRKISPFKAV